MSPLKPDGMWAKARPFHAFYDADPADGRSVLLTATKTDAAYVTKIGQLVWKAV